MIIKFNKNNNKNNKKLIQCSPKWVMPLKKINLKVSSNNLKVTIIPMSIKMTINNWVISIIQAILTLLS